MPEIKDFGKRFFLEMCDTKFQTHLIKQFMKLLNSMYSDLLAVH